jgi:hypothetical protein
MVFVHEKTQTTKNQLFAFRGGEYRIVNATLNALVYKVL